MLQDLQAKFTITQYPIHLGFMSASIAHKVLEKFITFTCLLLCSRDTLSQIGALLQMRGS